MAFKHYDVVRAASPSDLAKRLTQKLKEGWQPFGSPVAITPYTLMQAIAAEGDVVVSGATEPKWYYVIVLAGQSNAMAYGEGLPLPDSYDAPHPRIKQLARRNTVTPGGEVCVFNDIIPADHCLHDVQDMSTINHPRADLSKGQYGCVGQGLHIAKKLLPYIPNNAGILLVPCCRGGSAFTQGTEGTFSESTGASQDSARWGVGKPLYQDLLFRTKAALQKNPKNVLLAICWMQGEFDISRWRIEQCSELSAVSASFVLSTPTETDGAVFPGRIMLANTCTWTYRGDECGYHGPAVADEYDQPTSDITKDKCSKCLSGCKFRNNVGNFGGFLSINKLSQ